VLRIIAFRTNPILSQILFGYLYELAQVLRLIHKHQNKNKMKKFTHFTM